MGVTRLWFGAELRQRWRQQVALALLAGFVGATVLTCVAAARRTDSTYRRYIAAQAVPQLETWSGEDRSKVPALIQSIESDPAVRATASYDTFFGAPLRKDILPGQDFLILAPADDHYSRTFDRPIVVDGRLPNPAAPDEVFVNERAAKALDLHVGTRTRLRSFSVGEAGALQSGDVKALKFAGPRPTVRVVGIGRTRFDLVAASYAQRYFITSHAFYEQNVDKMFGFGQLIVVRIDPGANVDAAATALAGRISKNPQTVDFSRLADSAKGLRGAARVESLALALVALIALAAGVVAMSQAIGRSVNASASDHATLASLGVDRRGRVRLNAISFLPPAMTAAGLALGGAWVASRWFPTGVARQAEVSTGAQFDTRVLLLGAALIVAGVVARAAFGAWRLTLTTAEPRKALRSVWLDRVTSTLAPPNATGVRWAVGPRDGSQAQSRAGIVGAMIAVAGLIGVITYTAGLNHVVSTPPAYGWHFDAYTTGGSDPSLVAKERDTVLAQKSIGDVGVVTVIGGAFRINGRAESALAFRDVRGHIGPSVVEGRAPQHDNEVLLGTKSAAALNVNIGDVVRLKGAAGTQANLEVVGLGLFPSLDSDEFTKGMATTPSSLRRLAGKAWEQAGGHEVVVFRWVPGTDADAAAARLRGAKVVTTPATPASDIANLRVVRNYPRWLAIFLGALGLLASTHALVVSTRRRRREMGVLRAIGFSRRQVSRAVSTQGATIGTTAVVIGVPFGIVIGRWVWVTHARRIGIGTGAPSPVFAIAIVAVIAVALTWLIATATGRHASRTRLTNALRIE